MITESEPIPVKLMEPWIADNQNYLEGIDERRRLLDGAESLRDDYDIRQSLPCERAPLAAVDAAIADIAIGDLVSILIQSVHVNDDGITTFDAPIRLTGVNGQELSLARTPLRVAIECSMLAGSECVTIADTSFWSMLMEVNQTITRYSNEGTQQQGLSRAYKTLVVEGTFLRMLRNTNVIAMSKTNQSVRLGKNTVPSAMATYVSDRELLGRILQPGEFLVPMRLVDGVDGNFGIEQRGFNDFEQREIRDIYNTALGLTYYKPHAWSRAFRIEGAWAKMNDDAWIMPLLSAIAYHTQDRTVEPWPQFMTDWNSKKIGAIAKLYGELNFHRTPFYDRARTIF